MEASPNPKKIKLLFVIGSLEIGGAEKQMIMLAGKLQLADFQCAVFSFQQGGKLFKDLSNLDIPVYYGGLNEDDHRRRAWRLAFTQMKLIQTILEYRPTVIHSFLPLANFLGALAGRICHVSLVITSLRALGNHQDRYWFLNPVDRVANILSHQVTVNSNAVGHDTVRRDHIDPSKMTLIYNGVDPLPFEAAFTEREKVRETLGLGNNEKVVITVANLIPYKGHRELLEAAQTVIRKLPGTRFLMVGKDRGIRGELQELSGRLGVEGNVHFLGLQKNIPHLLAASDLSVLPSHEEGFSNVILESMAAGLPVVATDVGGNKEAVVDGATGWLVPPKEPGILAERMSDLLENSEKARMWGEKGRRRVCEVFSAENMVKNHIRLYESGLGIG
jgi:glycosyltransferase involved in cell wall biosynthesis